MSDPTPDFVVTETDGKWCLQASRRRVVRMAVMFCITAATAVGGGIIFDYFNGSHWVVIFGAFVAVVALGIAVWAWRTGDGPLSIDMQTGAVCFGQKEICGPGTVQAVVLRRDTNPEGGQDECSIEFGLTDGTLVGVRAPAYFRIGNLAYTSALAEQMAAKLKVTVVREWENPRRRIAVLIGVGLFSLFWSAITLTFDGFLAWTVYRQILAHTYPATVGLVTHSEVETDFDSDGGFSHSPRIKYKYQVAGRDYSSSRYRFGSADADAYSIVSEHPLGRRVAVYYDRDDPAKALLRPGVAGSELFMAMFLLPFNVIMLGTWWFVGTKARGQRLVPEAGTPVKFGGTELRLKVPQFRPVTLAAIVASLLAFGATFIVGFGFGGFHPSMRVMCVVWTVILVCAGGAYLKGRRMLAADGADEFSDGTDPSAIA